MRMMNVTARMKFNLIFLIPMVILVMITLIFS